MNIQKLRSLLVAVVLAAPSLSYAQVVVASKQRDGISGVVTISPDQSDIESSFQNNNDYAVTVHYFFHFACSAAPNYNLEMSDNMVMIAPHGQGGDSRTGCFGRNNNIIPKDLDIYQVDQR